MAGGAQIEEAAQGFHQEGDVFSPLHELSSAGSWLGEICFSQFFGDILDRLIVPGKEGHLSINDDFDLRLSPIDRENAFVYDYPKTFTTGYLKNEGPRFGQQRCDPSYEV